MKFTIVALAAAAAVSAEVVFDNGEFKCLGESAGKNFCAGTSLQTNIIIRCTGEKGQPGNCNNNLAGVPPVGVKTSATCYQSSETAGDAGCSFAGVVYPDSGEPYPVPGYAPPPTYDTTTTTSSVYVPPPTYDTTTTTSSVYVPPPTYVPPPPEYTTTSSVYVPPPYYPPVNTTTYSPPPPPTYYPPTTLSTVTGTTTITTCSTTKAPEPPVPTTYVPPPPANTTSYTTSLPVPTYIPSSASNNVASGSLILGAIAAIGFLFL